MQSNKQSNEKLLSLPELAGVDALVAMSPENFAYVGGTFILTVELLRPRHGYAIVAKDSDPVLVVCSIETSLAQEESWIEDIRSYTEFKDNPIDILVGVLKEKGLAAGKIGIDLSYLPYNSYALLVDRLPDAEIVDTTDIVSTMRSVKTGAEVAKIASATQITHTSVIEAMAASQLGETEKTMMDRIVTGLLERGAEGSLFGVFGSGERTRMPHALATDRVPKESEIIRFDVGGRFGPWKSDLARTYSTGNPTETQREFYRNLREAQEATIEMIRPGVLAEEVYYACKEEFEKRGLDWWLPHCGHGFGIELHEDPMLRPGEKTVLKEGMVFNVEPFGFDKDGIGYHLEDLMVVTESGTRLLTHGLAPTEIPVIGKPLDQQ
jgi:Xaa-Pro aminopeptidase